MDVCINKYIKLIKPLKTGIYIIIKNIIKELFLKEELNICDK